MRIFLFSNQWKHVQWKTLFLRSIFVPPGNSHLIWGWVDPLLSSDLKQKIQKISLGAALQRYSSSTRLIKNFPAEKGIVSCD